MRKILTTSLVTMLAVVFACGLAFALTGQCVNCHTMHNSQDGVAMTVGGGPFPQLLRADCIPCHTQTVSGNVDPVNSFSAPIVWSTTLPTGQGGGFTTAGGDFYWVADTGGNTDSMGHNVAGIAVQDAALGMTPPGFDPNATPGALSDGQINGGTGTWSTQLTCAGVYGCHGNHSDATQMGGIRGSHHGNVGGTSTQASTPATVGGSYRFLGGIKGLEKSDWNWVETSVLHNEYYGVNDTSNRNQTNATYADKTTISYACAECHGYFHSRIDDTSTGSPWLRHPTDVDLPNTGEYASYNPDNGNVYSVEAPIARPTVPATSSATVTPGTDIVMCLSCHRAHGSPQPDILRWDYTTMVTGTGTGSTTSDTGCFTCHTAKNAD